MLRHLALSVLGNVRTARYHALQSCAREADQTEAILATRSVNRCRSPDMVRGRTLKTALTQGNVATLIISSSSEGKIRPGVLPVVLKRNLISRFQIVMIIERPCRFPDDADMCFSVAV